MTSRSRLTLRGALSALAIATAAPGWAQAGSGAAGAASPEAPSPGNGAPPAAVDQLPAQPYGCPFQKGKLQLLV
jgi:hypothetical protein